MTVPIETNETLANSRPPAGQAAAKPPGRGGVSVAVIIPIILVAAGAAYFAGRNTAPASPPTASAASEPDTAEAANGEAGGNTITLSPGAEKTADIRTVLARRVPLAEILTVPGTVEVSPNRGAVVTSPVSGRLIDLIAAPGDRVEAGQMLARLDSPEVAQAHAAVREAAARVADARSTVQAAEAGIEQASTKVGSMRSALSRQRELAASGQIAQPSLQAAQNELSDSQAAQKEAEAGLSLAQSITARAQRLLDAQIAPKAELEQAQTAERQATAQAERTRQRVAVAQAALSREQRVYGSGLLNRQAVQGAEAELRAAQGEVRQAQKQAQSARTALAGAASALSAATANLRATEGDGHAEGGAGLIALYSPIAGTVAERKASPGQAVERASELFNVQNLSAVTVVANVPEGSVGQIRSGAAVAVTVPAYPKATFTGTVQGVGSAVDEKTRALPVRCLVRNPGGALKPEMFARVSLLTSKSRMGIAVPDAALDEDGDKRFVYVAAGGGYEKREVKAGKTSKGMTEIASGLKEGERVVTDGMFVLKSESKKDELKEEE